METRRTSRLKWDVANYKELVNSHCKIDSRSRQCSVKRQREKLYPVEIVEQREDGCLKIHYIGYDESYDEWKNEEELEVLDKENPPTVEPPKAKNPRPEPVLQPYSLYKDLSFRIKRSLTCNRKGSPHIKVSMPFDILLFNGGLKVAGIPSKVVGGVQQYKIKNYRDLNHLLGDNWHFRAINANADYGYVELETVVFYIRRSRPIVEYMFNKDNIVTAKPLDTGYSLTFSFVYNYGTLATFGKDKTIFYK